MGWMDVDFYMNYECCLVRGCLCYCDIIHVLLSLKALMYSYSATIVTSTIYL
jgi:hypothetical protein